MNLKNCTDDNRGGFVPVLSGYWFFPVPGGVVLANSWNLTYMQGINIYIPKFLDQCDINILFLLWINNYWRCIRVNFCNITYLEPPNLIMHMGWSFHNLIENLQLFASRIVIRVTNCTCLQRGHTYDLHTSSPSQFEPKHCIHDDLNPIPTCCSLLTNFVKNIIKRNY
jgi:hypothetical protein